MLREVRRRPATDEWTAVSGVDPLNLAGILTPGPRLAAHCRQSIALSRWRPGRPSCPPAKIRFFDELDPATEWFCAKSAGARHEAVTLHRDP